MKQDEFKAPYFYTKIMWLIYRYFIIIIRDPRVQLLCILQKLVSGFDNYHCVNCSSCISLYLSIILTENFHGFGLPNNSLEFVTSFERPGRYFYSVIIIVVWHLFIYRFRKYADRFETS